MKIQPLIAHLDELLKPQAFDDFTPNGLQIAGVDHVQCLVTGVSANQALINAAIDAKAHALLVHHGFFWKGEVPGITGIHHKRYASLIKNNINLIAYHLPLDGHDSLGNNVQLAQALGIKVTGTFSVHHGPGIGRLGHLNYVMSGTDFADHINTVLQRKPLYIPGKSRVVNTIAWSTGAAQDLIFSAAKAGVDAFLTGEVSERTVAFAKELGLHFYAAGHHATERYGIQALGTYLASEFNLKHQFIDIDNPV